MTKIDFSKNPDTFVRQPLDKEKEQDYEDITPGKQSGRGQAPASSIPWRIRGGGPEAVQLPEPPIDMPGPEAVPMDMPIDMDMGMPEVDITMQSTCWNKCAMIGHQNNEKQINIVGNS